MAFRGWRAQAIEFFEGLEADNSKSYWQAHKTVYEQEVRAPMEGLLAELEPAYGDGKIFRPYRDVRFSADKSPYKTNIAATIGRRYVQLNADAFGVGCGRWEMSSEDLERYREAVDDDRSGRELVKLVEAASTAGLEISGHEVLKTAPRGYPKDHPRIELLRYKGLIGWREWPVGKWLGTKRVKDRVIEVFDASAPLDAWLERNV
ncbi:MAG: DUF2461 domain-containing protein [Actinomycetota bacterium]|jgi:uncharacterized protein (TIGR02453 family)